MSTTLQTPTREEIDRLITRFDHNIRYDAHSLPIKYNRSEARKSLEVIGKAALTQIGHHIRTNYADKELSAVDKDAFDGWRMLLEDMLAGPPSSDDEDPKNWMTACFHEGGSSE